jgi:hypothetical protein
MTVCAVLSRSRATPTWSPGLVACQGALQVMADNPDMQALMVQLDGVQSMLRRLQGSVQVSCGRHQMLCLPPPPPSLTHRHLPPSQPRKPPPPQCCLWSMAVEQTPDLATAILGTLTMLCFPVTSKCNQLVGDGLHVILTAVDVNAEDPEFLMGSMRLVSAIALQVGGVVLF